MTTVGKPFSGKVDSSRRSRWPITHMVARRRKALACNEYHARGGRLDKVRRHLHPGPGGNRLVDTVGLGWHRRQDWRRAGPWLIRFVNRKH